MIKAKLKIGINSLLFEETIEAYRCTVAKVTYGSMCEGAWGVPE